MSIQTRLRFLERVTEPTKPRTIFRIFWPDELVPCDQHPRCDVEVATDEHHRGVFHLAFDSKAI